MRLDWSIAFGVLALGSPMALAQATIHVDTNCGNDSWSGIRDVCAAPDGPKATIRAAVLAACVIDCQRLGRGFVIRGGEDRSPDVAFSTIQGGFAGLGVIDADPLFVDAGAGDFRLSAGSPAIDAGDNLAVPDGVEVDRAGLPRFVGDASTPDTGRDGGAGGVRVVDMGAHEFPGVRCRADFDGDGSLTLFDFLAFQNEFAAGCE